MTADGTKMMWARLNSSKYGKIWLQKHTRTTVFGLRELALLLNLVPSLSLSNALKTPLKVCENLQKATAASDK